MVANKEIIEMIAHKLVEYKAKNIVADPVMVSTTGSRLMEEDAANTLIEKLLPLATVITPNLTVTEVLCGFAINTKEDCIKAAQSYFAKDTDCYFN